MVTLSVLEVLPYLYSLHQDGQFEVEGKLSEPIEFKVISNTGAAQRLAQQMTIAIQQSATYKIKYLHDRYHFVTDNQFLRFQGTCLETVNTWTGSITWRKRSEWFRKWITDFIFVTQICPGHREYICRIPSLWIRPLSTPLLKLWLEDMGLPIWERHLNTADATINRYPVEKLIFLQHRVTRRILLRYYYRLGYFPDPERRHFHFSRSARTPIPPELEFNPDLDIGDPAVQRFSFWNSAKESEE